MFFVKFLFILGVNMLSASQNLSHEQRESSFLKSKELLVNKILSQGNLPYISEQERLDILDQLCEFEFGRFLIERGGLDGYWTQYVIQYPEKKATYNEISSNLEAFLLNQAPTSLATQERFKIFKSQVQKLVKEGCCFASIPCGVMAELLDIDYSHIQKFSLSGIDLDSKSISLAKNYAEEKDLSSYCNFIEGDAWQLNTCEKYDLITSNGLNIYESDNEKTVQLYSQFYNALKKDGILITSFLTPPPIPGKHSEWKLDEVDQKDALFQKIVFSDVLHVKWQVFRTEAQTKKQLRGAGFKQVEIIYDKAHIFPTVVARK